MEVDAQQCGLEVRVRDVPGAACLGGPVRQQLSLLELDGHDARAVGRVEAREHLHGTREEELVVAQLGRWSALRVGVPQRRAEGTRATAEVVEEADEMELRGVRLGAREKRRRILQHRARRRELALEEELLERLARGFAALEELHEERDAHLGRLGVVHRRVHRQLGQRSEAHLGECLTAVSILVLHNGGERVRRAVEYILPRVGGVQTRRIGDREVDDR